MKLIAVVHSDGKRVVKKSKHKKVNNRPTRAQLKKVVDSDGNYNYYQELRHSSSKNMEWRKKLGGMLVAERQKSYEEIDTGQWSHLLTVINLR